MAVIFDLDDTLYRERRFVLSGHAALARVVADETGMPARVLFRFLARRFRRHGREGLLQAFCAAYALPVAEVPRYVEIIRTHAPRLRLPRTSREVLAALRGQGRRLGVLTNGLPGTQRAKVAALGLAAHVDVVTYAQEHAPEGKPARGCFVAALRALGVDAGRAVFVGDHPQKDIAGAAALGLRTIWLPDRATAIATTPADAVARTLADVPPLVARLLEDRHVRAC
ncbi:HAD superfamily hydrolase [Luteitalea sp. TBR-22]|nr:HAD superfamily hydrolase [Luteitalea sp. TBR-22]